MTTLEQIHQHLTVTGDNNYDLHGGEAEFIRVQSPCVWYGNTGNWTVELIWDHHDGEIKVAYFISPSLSEAAEDMLNYLRERDRAKNLPVEL